MIHRCHAHLCKRQVLPRLLFCAWHWKKTRHDLQKAIWREYRKGQEVTKTPTIRYLAVQKLAIAELVYDPKDPEKAFWAQCYLGKAEEYRQLAIARGEGDPFQLVRMLDLSSAQGLLPLWAPGKREQTADSRHHTAKSGEQTAESGEAESGEAEEEP